MTTSVTSTRPEASTVKRNWFDRIYSGEGAIEFIKRSKLWYIITLVLVALSIGSIAIRGFDLGIDFEGGTKISMPAGELTTEAVGETFHETIGVEPELVQIVGSGDARILEINSVTLTEDEAQQARVAIVETFGNDDLTFSDVGVSNVSESWGSTITQRMVMSMLVFLVLAGIYVAVRLERDMAAAALIALVFDGIVIAGFYSIFGLEVTPAVVIGLLTVLTFSIYDTVIVFDKVKENTEGVLSSRRATFAEQANLAVNQTVMRSLSTSIISALPIIALFVVAVWMMGIGTLRDLAVIQLVGVIEGLLSSLFLATPLLVSIVNAKKAYREHNQAVAEYRSAGGDADVSDSYVGATRTVIGPDERQHYSAEAPRRAARVPHEAEEIPEGRETNATWRPNRLH